MATTSSPSSFRVRASLLTLIIFLFIFNISITTSYQIPDPRPSIKIPYSDHCNTIVPESKSNNIHLSPSEFLQLQNGYYSAADKFLSQILQSSFDSPKSLVFRTRNLYNTDTEGVQKVEASLIFFGSSRYPTATFGGGGGGRGIGGAAYPRGRGKLIYRGGPARFRGRRSRLAFTLEGFYSQSTGKLCMVGAATTFSKEGNMLELSGVFKLNYPNNSTILTSLISGTLESVGKTVDSADYFEPISILAFSQRNYNYTLILKEYENGFDNAGNRKEMLPSLGFDSVGGICSALIGSSNDFELEYENGCVDAGNCNVLGKSVEFLPDSISFSGIQCSPDKKRLRLLIGFKNGTYFGYRDALVPSTTLVGEGLWDVEKNQLHVIACRILNFTDSLASASVGNCSIRLSLRFPAVRSLRSRSTVVGEIWSNKTVNESDYFGRVLFQSSASRMSGVQGLKYEYTVNKTAINSCMEKKSLKNKGKKYPDRNSYDMKFDMLVKDSKGKVVSGYAIPLSVADEFYNKLGFVYQGSGIFKANHSQSRLLNISYMIGFTPPPGFGLAGRLTSNNMPLNQNKPYDIAAEGIYDTETGKLCMMGCRRLWLNHQNSTISDSMDCNITISIQFPPLNSNSGETVKGSIQSTRTNTDSLHFNRLELSSMAMYTTQAKESIWRMDLEIIMVLISNTLACVFIGLQLYYVKKHPDVISSISIVMLVILTLGHMIPLVLNFEALFFTNRYRQHVLTGSGGWLEVNEVIVRVVTMVAFLLQFRLLQLTWSARMSNSGQKELWNAEKNSLCVSVPLFIVGALIALMIHWFKNHYSRGPHLRGHILVSYQSHSILRDMRSYAGLVRDNFLLPQILLNIFSNSKDMALSPLFYIGTSVVRLLPHAYDLYRHHSYANVNPEFEIYAKHTGDFFSTAWDVIIICVSLLFAGLIYFQQRFGGRCILPQRFKQQSAYEMVPIDSSEGL